MDGELPENFGSTLPDLSVGSRIASYRLEERVRAGGMAVVFRALDERLGRQVALKVLSEELAADESFRQRFIRESKAAAAVDDPYLIPIYEAGEASGVLFIAMRYAPGGDAQSLLRRDGPLSAERVAAIISPVASALDAAHAAGLVHRDVKPANILLDSRQGRPDHPYLADFGISKRTQSLARLTGTGQFLGTVDYAAPEQIQGSSADGRADQYALACTVFELLSGEVPFRRDDPSAVIWSKMTEPPPLLTSRRADLPAAVNRVLAKALAKTPQDRYPTCEEFSDALRKAFGLNSGTPIPQVGQPQTPSEHPADVTGAEQLAAAHDEQDQSTRDASGLPIPNPVKDRRQHRRSHYHSPNRFTSSNSPVPVSAVKARRAGIAMPESGYRSALLRSTEAGSSLSRRIADVAAHIFMRWPDAAVSDAPDRETPCANFSRKDFVFGLATTGGLLTPNHYADYPLWPPCTGSLVPPGAANEGGTRQVR